MLLLITSTTQNDHTSGEVAFWRGFPERLTPFFRGLVRFGWAVGVGILISGNPEYLPGWFAVVMVSLILCAFFAWTPHIGEIRTKLSSRFFLFRSVDLVLLIVFQVALLRLTTQFMNLDITVWDARLGRIGATLTTMVSVLTFVRTYRHAFLLFWESDFADSLRKGWGWLKTRVEGGPALLVLGIAAYLAWTDMNNPHRLLQVYETMILPSTLLISMIAVNIIWSPHRQDMNLEEFQEEIRSFLNVALVVFGVLMLYLVSATAEPFPETIPESGFVDTVLKSLSIGLRSVQALAAGVVGGGLGVVLVGFARMGKETLQGDVNE